MSTLYSYVEKIKYLVISQDKSPSLFTSLREIAREIQVDPSTISKNLKDVRSCYCQSKKTNNIFYICKI